MLILAWQTFKKFVLNAINNPTRFLIIINTVLVRSTYKSQPHAIFFIIFLAVTSIQSFPQDAKTPVAEAVSPLSEKPKILAGIVAPKQSDFPQNDVDPYSELCTQQLDSLANLDEELEIDKAPPVSPKEKQKEATIVKPQQLEPLDLNQSETKQQLQQQQQQPKLTTPGEWFCAAASRKTVGS